MILNIVKKEVIASISLNNGFSRSILREPSRGAKYATSDPQNLKPSHTIKSGLKKILFYRSLLT